MFGLFIVKSSAIGFEISLEIVRKPPECAEALLVAIENVWHQKGIARKASTARISVPRVVVTVPRVVT